MIPLKIDQVAIAVPDVSSAIRQISHLFGESEWHRDVVVTTGTVDGQEAKETVAELAFNYDLIPGVEVELIHYLSGKNWHDYRFQRVSEQPFLSHLGMHIDDQHEFNNVRAVALALGFPEIQHVNTLSHTNPAIKDSRRYEYVIFDTHRLLGFDFKIIRRKGLEIDHDSI